MPFAGLTDCSPVRTQSGIVNTLPLKAIRLLAGGEAKIGGTLASVIFGAARLHFTEEVFLEWLESISRVPYLESELGQLPSTFESIYVRG